MAKQKYHLKSMSGYGAAVGYFPPWKIQVELRSVNLKNMEIHAKLSPELYPFEQLLREVIQQRIHRGKILLNVDLSFENIREEIVNYYAPRWKELYETLNDLNKKMNIKTAPTWDNIFELKEFFRPSKGKSLACLKNKKKFLSALKKTINDALDAIMEMKQIEGKNLAGNIKTHLSGVKKILKIVKEKALRIPGIHKKRMEDLIEKYNLKQKTDPDRLEYEVALLIDKSDITEELERLESHLKQFEYALVYKYPVGKELNFLLLEMMREFNTIGSKSNSKDIVGESLAARVGLEKIREQVQNIE